VSVNELIPLYRRGLTHLFLGRTSHASLHIGGVTWLHSGYTTVDVKLDRDY